MTTAPTLSPWPAPAVPTSALAAAPPNPAAAPQVSEPSTRGALLSRPPEVHVRTQHDIHDWLCKQPQRLDFHTVTAIHQHIGGGDVAERLTGRAG